MKFTQLAMSYRITAFDYNQHIKVHKDESPQLQLVQGLDNEATTSEFCYLRETGCFHTRHLLQCVGQHHHVSMHQLSLHLYTVEREIVSVLHVCNSTFLLQPLHQLYIIMGSEVYIKIKNCIFTAIKINSISTLFNTTDCKIYYFL